MTETEVRERPILFSAAMVRAVLDGGKSQTRRVMKQQPTAENVAAMGAPMMRNLSYPGAPSRWKHARDIDGIGTPTWKCPYGQPGDRLWVRETWSHDAESLERCRASHEDIMGPGMYGPYYRATESAPDTLKWRPSIHMPRWASRIDLEVTAVRVERLQEITWQDALAEGIPYQMCCSGHECGCRGLPVDNPITDFQDLWDSISAKRGHSWEQNDFVWVVEFKRL